MTDRSGIVEVEIVPNMQPFIEAVHRFASALGETCDQITAVFEKIHRTIEQPVTHHSLGMLQDWQVKTPKTHALTGQEWQPFEAALSITLEETR